MCVSPYIARTKEGKLVPVPCGHCIECLNDWQKDWSFRLHQEVKHLACPIHLTLTYAPGHLPLKFNEEVNEWQSYVSKREIQLFLKRLRKMCPEFKNNLRYFAVGEYGSDEDKAANGRAHYHIILMSPVFRTTHQYYKAFLRAWGKGFIRCKFAGEKQIGYLTGYLNKLDKSSHITKPFKLFSKHLGLCYLTEAVVKYFLTQFKTGVIGPKGYWQRLPRYYRKKLDDLSVTNPMLKQSGLTYSDVVRFKPFTPKGIQVFFNEFCTHFDEYQSSLRKEEITNCRREGRNFQELNVQQLFDRFCHKIPEVMNKRATSERRLEDIMIKHLHTKIYPHDFTNFQVDESIIQYGKYTVQKKKPIRPKPRIPINNGFWQIDPDSMRTSSAERPLSDILQSQG